jgi:hypothetical protein
LDQQLYALDLKYIGVFGNYKYGSRAAYLKAEASSSGRFNTIQNSSEPWKLFLL